MARPQSIRVLTADPNQMASRLLAEALRREPGIAVVATVHDYDSLTQAVLSAKPDVALLSAGLPGRPVAPANSETASYVLPCPWILLLDENKPQVIVGAFRSGARGVFSRSQSDIRLLAKCIRRVVEGQVWVDSKQMLFLLDALCGNNFDEATQSAPKLTRREESVVRLVTQGLVNREIADQLRLSEHTVKNYLFRIYDKLGVSNRVELALYAVARLRLDEEVAA